MKNWKEKTLLYKLFFTEIWELGLIKADLLKAESFFSKKDQVLKQKHFLKNVTSQLSFSFIADPFGVLYKDHYYIYFEYLNYRYKKGEIRYNKYDKELNLLKSGTALNKSFHLSYPYLFQEKDTLYMIPEMAACKSGKQSIFILNSDSDIWEEQCINIPAMVDPCIIKEGDSYFIFGNLKRKKVSYRSNNILEGYKEIEYVSNHDHFQSGGKIFNINDSIYRPLQISDKTYGEKILVTKLNLKNSSIEESKDFTVITADDYEGFHTISPIDDRYVVIDVKNFKFSIFKFFISLQQTINKRKRRFAKSF